MKKIKLLITVTVFLLIYSCSKEERNFDFDVQKEYYNVINSKTPKIEFEKYTLEEKAKLWEYKYRIFIKNSSLTEKQILLINELKDFAVNTIVYNKNSNVQNIETIQKNLLSNFTEAQYFDLLYFLDTPSISSKNENNSKVCFWCTMYEPVGDCFYDEHGDYLQHAHFYNCRFWHCSDAGDGLIMCQN